MNILKKDRNFKMLFLFFFVNIILNFLTFSEGDIYFSYLLLLSFLFFFLKQKDSIYFEEDLLKSSKIYFFLELENWSQKGELKRSLLTFLFFISYVKEKVRENFFSLREKFSLFVFSQEALLLRKTFVSFMEKRKGGERQALWGVAHACSKKGVIKYI